MRKRSSTTVIVMLVLCGGLVVGLSAAAQSTPPGPPGTDTGVSAAIEQKLILSQAQRTAIYDQVSKDKSIAPKDFSPVIGADVPPMIELYTLPDDAVAGVPAAKLYKYTMVENKVVLVDPTKMRVVDVIGPPPSN